MADCAWTQPMLLLSFEWGSSCWLQSKAGADSLTNVAVDDVVADVASIAVADGVCEGDWVAAGAVLRILW